MPRYSSEEEKSDKLKKHLESAGHYSKLLQVVARIFQRTPDLVQELEDQVEVEGGGVSARKKRLVELVVEKVEELCENVELALELSLPSSFNSYLTYTELVLLRVKSESSSGRQWRVYKLRRFQARQDTELNTNHDHESWALRTKLKKKLKEAGQLASIQTEGDDNRIWVRIASVKASKKKEKDKKKLETARPLFVVHYPGEPYFYSTGNLSDVLQSALVACLGCEEAIQLDLSGKCLTSLRNLRLGKDAREGQARQEVRTAPDRFSVLNKEAEAGQTSHPKLETVTLNISGQRSESPLSCTVTIAGTDVIGGLEELVRAGVISSPAPQWVRDLSIAGKNKFKMEAQGVYRDDDMDSVLSKAWV